MQSSLPEESLPEIFSCPTFNAMQWIARMRRAHAAAAEQRQQGTIPASPKIQCVHLDSHGTDSPLRLLAPLVRETKCLCLQQILRCSRIVSMYHCIIIWTYTEGKKLTFIVEPSGPHARVIFFVIRAHRKKVVGGGSRCAALWKAIVRLQLG